MVYSVSSHSIPDSATHVIRTKTLELSKKSTAYMREKWPEADTKLIKNLTGGPERISWVSKFESLEKAVQFDKIFWQDSGVKEISDEWAKAEEDLGSLLLVQTTRNYLTDIE